MVFIKKIFEKGFLKMEKWVIMLPLLSRKKILENLSKNYEYHFFAMPYPSKYWLKIEGLYIK